MIRLGAAEVQRATGRRLVRTLLVLGALVAAVAGAIAFLRSSTLDQAVYEQRVVEAKARQNQVEREIQRCVEEHGGRSEEAFKACEPKQPPARAKDPRFHRDRLKGILQGTTGVAVLVAWLVGASLVGAEYTSRGIVTTLGFEPGRVRVFTAKAVAAVATGAAVALVLLLVMLAAMLPAAIVHGAPAAGEASNATLAGVVLRGTAMAAIAAAIGFALASVGRNTATALGVGFGYILVLENILGSSIEGWRRWLLLGNTIVFVSGENAGGDVPGRSVTGAGIFLAAVGVALLIGALGMFSRRDVG
ncbi:MAG: ABC transporter permease subunit [Acidimicrobiales bacterium]